VLLKNELGVPARPSAGLRRFGPDELGDASTWRLAGDSG
jgi:hypothetical protein